MHGNIPKAARQEARAAPERKASRSGASSRRARSQRNGQKVAILVAGMHRSGTSALTRVLSLLGCDLPKTPSADPEHWESKIVMDLNDAILASAGSAWHDWEPFNPNWYASPVSDPFREKAQVALRGEFGESRLFVLKDPRICRLLPFWIEAAKSFGARPAVILPIRNPLEVAVSLEARDGIDPSVGQLLWMRHVLDAEAASRGLKRALTRYDDLLSDGLAVSERLAESLGVSWPRRSTAAATEIESYISPAKRHHLENDSRLLANPALSPWVRSAFEVLARCAQGDVRESDAADLDRIRGAFDEATDTFSRPVLAGREPARRGRSLALRAGELEAELKSRDAQAKELTGRLQAGEAKAKELTGRLQAREAEAKELTGRLQAREAEAKELTGRNAALAKEIKIFRAEAKERKSQLKVRGERLHYLKARLLQHQRALQGVRSSTSWRVTRPLRGLSLSARWLSRNLRRAAKLAGWLATGQFGRAADAALPYYRKLARLGPRGRVQPRGGRRPPNAPAEKTQPDDEASPVAGRDLRPKGLKKKGAKTPQEKSAPKNTPREESAPKGAIREGSDYDLRIETLTQERLRGWCVHRDLSRVFDLDVLIDGILFQTVKNGCLRSDLKRLGLSAGHGGFDVPLPSSYFEAGSHTVSVRLPDGATHSRTLASAPASQRLRWTMPDGSAMLAGATSVVVPVYNAADDLAVCIERLAAYTAETADILFIDDASPDLRIAQILAGAVSRDNMRVLRNDTNLGFAATVNRGLSETGRNDVIILNSDARVTPGWFDGLRAAASSGPRIATVTPMSDRAGAFSAPDIGNDNDLPPGVDEITYARAFRRRGLGFYPSVPTGNGFCMFISRACMDDIGILDAEAFPGGYCEENDFCMRAVRAGWRNIIDDRTYVFHGRSKSFGAAKTELMSAHRAVIDSRYPEYKKAIAVFSDGMLPNLVRFQARCALIDCETASASLPRALYVISTQSGGTPQTNNDLMAALGDALDTWVLRCDSRKLELSRFRDGVFHLVQQHQLSEPVDPVTHASFEYDAVVAEWIRNLDVDLVHIRHLVWHSLSLPQIAKAAGKKVLFSFHDYYVLCATIKLLDETGTFCEGRCTASQGQCRPELWPADAFPPLKGNWVHIWREKFSRVLACCDGFVTTSESARARILQGIRGLPADRFWVIPHGRDFPDMQRLRELPLEGEPLRILLPGSIGVAKGAGIVNALLERDTDGRLEFHVVGKFQMPDRALDPRIRVHGRYERENFAEKVAPIRPHLGAIFSIWDETFCHTLTELWSVGLPAIVLDFPTLASRVRESGAGWVMDHRDIDALYDEIIRIGYDREEQVAKDEALTRWQSGIGAGDTSRLMAAKYLEVYRIIMDRGGKDDATTPLSVEASPRNRARLPRVAVLCPEGERTERVAASSEGRICDRTRNRLDREITFVGMSPSTMLANLRAGEIDGAILQRDAIPRALAPELSRAFAEFGVPYLLDLGDDPLNVPSNKGPAGSCGEADSVLRELLGAAAVATVSSSSLLSAYRPPHRNMVLLPDRLSLALWRGLPAERQPDGVVRALYMGSTTHPADIELVHPALERAARECPDFRLAVIGGATGEFPDQAWAERIDVPPDATSYSRFVPWLRSVADQFDFAIAPLEDGAFNACKSPATILQCGALGLPVLASDVPAYREAAQAAPGVEAVSNTAEGWTSAILAQVRLGAEHRRNEGLSLHRWVLETQALEPTLSDFDALILSMLESGQPTAAIVRDSTEAESDRVAALEA